MSAKATQEVLTICQPEEVLISSKRGSVPRLCCVLKKQMYGGRKNWGYQVVAWTPVSTRHPNVPRIREFLSTIYLKIQSDSCIIYLNVEDFREY